MHRLSNQRLFGKRLAWTESPGEGVLIRFFGGGVPLGL